MQLTAVKPPHEQFAGTEVLIEFLTNGVAAMGADPLAATKDAPRTPIQPSAAKRALDAVVARSRDAGPGASGGHESPRTGYVGPMTADGHRETPRLGDEPISAKRIDRNWNELLQEIRVVETGVQILTGFLLTVPFSSRFAGLSELQRSIYLVVLSGAVLTTALIVAPVAFHRVLFRHRARPWLVEAANRCARAGLVVLGLTICGVLFVVFDVVAGWFAAGLALAFGATTFVVLWGIVPWRMLLRLSLEDDAP
ncbi:MAG: sodium:proton antiporter [Marmoricola sp.]|nr:sodium:proton antiporter [Marmoricola sp.]